MLFYYVHYVYQKNQLGARLGKRQGHAQKHRQDCEHPKNAQFDI